MRSSNKDIELYMKGKRDGKKELQERIDKAIEYIKPKFVEQGGFTSYEWNDLLNNLLGILKGE